MRHKLLSILLLLLVVPLISVAHSNYRIHPKTQARIDFEVFKAETEITLKHLNENQEKALANVANARSFQLDTQNNKIDLMSTQIDRFGVLVTIGGVTVTLLLLVVGFMTYRSSRNEAVTSAKLTADAWFKENDHVKSLREEMESLRQEVIDLSKKAKEIIEVEVNKISTIGIDIKRALTPQEADALKARATKIKQKSVDSRTAEDWYQLVLNAYFEENNKHEAIAYCNLIINLSSSDALQKASAYYVKGYIQTEVEPKGAISTYDELIGKFCGLDVAEVQEQIVKAYIYKAVTQRQDLNDAKSAVATYEALIEKFGDSDVPVVQESLARAYFDKGVTQHQGLNDVESAMATYEELIGKFGDSDIAVVQESVARAYFDKGLAQRQYLNDAESAMATYDALIGKFGSSAVAEVQEQIANAYFNKGFTQGDALDDAESAIETYDALIAKFGDSAVAGVQESVARAYLNKGFTQGQYFNDAESAIVTYEELIGKFGDSAVAGVQEWVARAINNNGFNQLILLKKEWRKIKAAERRITLNSVLELLQLALEKNDQDAAAMGNKAYCLWLLNDKEEVELTLKQALSFGGAGLYAAIVEDTEWHAVPADKTFKKLLDKVWAEVQVEQEQQDGDDSQAPVE